jgi:hypothetical protein
MSEEKNYEYKETKGFKIVPNELDVKELRIGNWIESYMAFLCPINGFSQPKIRDIKLDAKMILFLSENPMATYRPIKLSSEILSVCDFEMPSKTFMLNQHWFLYDNYDGFWIQIEKQLESDYVCERLKVNCKYLHQLQNLYYSLTGQELEVNL